MVTRANMAGLNHSRGVRIQRKQADTAEVHSEKTASSNSTGQTMGIRLPQTDPHRSGVIPWLQELQAVLARALQSKPVVQEIEMQEMHGPWPILRPLSDTIGPRVRKGQGAPKQAVRFRETLEPVSMPNGDEIQLNRKAYNDMHMAQAELQGHMKRLKVRLSEFPEGDARDFVKEAVQTFEHNQATRMAVFESVSNLFRGMESLRQPKSRKELADQLFAFGALLNGSNRSLKVAQEELQYAERPADADIEAIRTCLQNYVDAVDQVLEPLKSKQAAVTPWKRSLKPPPAQTR